MPYVILQQSLQMPTVDRLEAAFRGVPGLVAGDAQVIARDAYGILVKGLSFDDAGRLQAALGEQGIPTEIVTETDLPDLPAGQKVRRADCQPDALMIHDPLGRNVPIGWGKVVLVAAGVVRMIEAGQGRGRRVLGGGFTSITSEWSQGDYLDTVTETKFKEERNLRLVLELVLGRGERRYSVNAEQFAFDYLGERRSHDLGSNFITLVRDLARYAPQAALNRGALRLLEDPPQAFTYPSRNAFQEEMIWLLWQTAQGRLSGGI